jgi:hypothetical protein
MDKAFMSPTDAAETMTDNKSRIDARGILNAHLGPAWLVGTSIEIFI